MNVPEPAAIELREALLAEERAAAAAFLDGLGLALEDDVEQTVLLAAGGRVVGTGSAAGEVLKCIAVAPELRGLNLTARIVDALLAGLRRRGRHHAFVYTSPAAAPLFEELGFRPLAQAAGQAVLLEQGRPDLADFLRPLAALRPGAEERPVGSVVVNCNPFTRGHRALLERAAAECRRVFVFVVEADRSSFPFMARLELVRRGSADLAPVTVLPGGPYIISSATFPNYFLKRSPLELLRVQTALDLDLFAGRIAPALAIERRYVGEEPLCAVTRAYNESMKTVLAGRGLELRIMPRRCDPTGELISASSVRRALAAGDWATVARMVPETTLEYLGSAEAAPVLRALAERPGERH